jgi:predicted metal-dependent HD superfamily phosphohydrolase
MTEAGLRERFGALWKGLGANAEPDVVADEVLQAYREPHRVYHGLDHLRDCLAQLDEAPDRPPEHALAEAALWFHDLVYVPGAADNEARSADRATAALLGGGVPEAGAREIARVIRLTDHASPAGDPLGALVCDVDLSILGRPPAEFAEYERRIRAEYRHVPEPLYRAGRAAVLTRLLGRRWLYGSTHFRSRYEEAARRNLARSLAALSRPVDSDADHVGGPR